MSRTFTSFFLCIVLLTVSSCIPQIKIEEEPTLGNLNIDEFLALGDRYVAGFNNGQREAGGLQGLYETAQINSFPNLIAQQLGPLKLRERGDSLVFQQHLLAEPGSGYYILDEINFRECDGAILSEQLLSIEPQPDWIEGRPIDNNFNNLGIPQLRVSELFEPGLLDQNAFFQRMKPRGTESEGYVGLLHGKKPSLILIWLGMEDLLLHAIRGGSNSAFPITPKEVFAENYARLLDSIETKTPEKYVGLIGNIPDLTRFPYFMGIPPRFIASENCRESGEAIFYEKNDGSIQIADEETALLLPLWNKLGTNIGSGGGFGSTPTNPVPNFWVLDNEEQQRIRNAVSSYNQVLDSLVDLANESRSRPKWVVTDLEKAFRDLDKGFTQGGLQVSMEHLSGGIFSLDGLTLTQRGNAFVANEFMDALDNQAKQSVRLNALNLSDYAGVVYP